MDRFVLLWLKLCWIYLVFAQDGVVEVENGASIDMISFESINATNERDAEIERRRNAVKEVTHDLNCD